MKEQLNVFLTYCTNAEKETIFFLLLRICFLALICYDFELDCFIKKTLHDCKVCSQKGIKSFVTRMLGLPTAEEIQVRLVQKKELEVKVVASEKLLWARKRAFVKYQTKVASLKADLSKSVTKLEGLFDEIEDTESEKQALFRSVWNKRSFYLEEEKKAKKKNQRLKDELLGLKLFEARNMPFPKIKK